VVEKIIEARQDGPFASLYDFCLRVDAKVLNKRVLESLLKAGAFSSLCKRSQGLLALDALLELAQQRQKDKESGQFSLFDFEDSLDEGFELPDVEEYSPKELLAMEKEYLGLYLSGHPLESVWPKLKEIVTEDILTCLEGDEDKRVILGGIVTGYRTTITKRGEMMASFALEDLTGAIEVLVFPKVFAQSTRLVNDQIVVVEGRYNIQDDERKIFAQRLLELDEALELFKPKQTSHSPQPPQLQKPQQSQQPPQQDSSFTGLKDNNSNKTAKKLYLRFPYEGSPHLEEVLQILPRYAGPNPVLFYFENNKKLIQTNRELWVNDGKELEQVLSKILGEANVAWKVSQAK